MKNYDYVGNEFMYLSQDGYVGIITNWNSDEQGTKPIFSYLYSYPATINELSDVPCRSDGAEY